MHALKSINKGDLTERTYILRDELLNNLHAACH